MKLFSEFIKRLPNNFQYGIELRNKNYLNKNYFEFIQNHKMSHVFLQGYWMPEISSVFEDGRESILKSDRVVIRLHGGDRKDIEERTKEIWNQIVDPRDNELSAAAKMITDLLDQEVDVYLNINNHYEGSAPLTIDRMRALLAI